MADKPKGMLVDQQRYLESGIHIGTKLKVVDMVPFIYRTRNDGLYVLDLRKVDERIALAGKELGRYEPGQVLVVASRIYSANAASKFCELTGAKLVAGRFMPGILTNAQREDYTEPKIIFVCDPKGEHQAIVESGKMGIPVIGLCDTDNYTSNIDWVIPCNNKGRRSLALIFWLLAREVLMAQGKLADYSQFVHTTDQFENGPEAPAAVPAEGAEGVGTVPAQAPVPAAVEEVPATAPE